PETGDHAVGGQLLREHVGEEAVLHERTRIEQQVEPLPDRQLVLLPQLGQIADAPLQCLFPQRPLPVAHVSPSPLRGGGSGWGPDGCSNLGSRFSKKALTPSFASSLSEIRLSWECRY